MRSRLLSPRITAAVALALSLAALPVWAKGPAKPAGPIDLNTASLNQLESLPGVGEVTAKKIVAGRPIKSVADLARVGVPAKTIDKITPLVTVGGAAAPAPAPKAAPAPAATAPAPAPKAAPATPAPAAPAAKPAPSAKGSAGLAAARAQAQAPAQTPPSPGMVWVNLDSKAYHKQGDKWYGRTKHGQFMTEADAKAAGYHPAGERKPKA